MSTSSAPGSLAGSVAGRRLLRALGLVVLLAGCLMPSVPAWCAPGDQLVLSGDHASLTGTTGGDGASLTYVHTINPDWVLSLGGEYQKLATAHWTFGSLNTSFSHALTGHTRWNFHAEGHEGSGYSGTHTFHYSIVAGGLGLTFPDGFAADVEDRHISVDTSRGSLPKLTLSKPWGRHWLTSAGYASSVGGNLDTAYGLARIDFYGPGFDLLGGGSYGRASPAVLNINGVLLSRARHIEEEFVGVTIPVERVAFTLIGDQLRLGSIKRVTATLNIAVTL